MIGQCAMYFHLTLTQLQSGCCNCAMTFYKWTIRSKYINDFVNLLTWNVTNAVSVVGCAYSFGAPDVTFVFFLF